MFSVLTVAAATFAFSASGMAQGVSPSSPSTDQVDNVYKKDGFGKRGHGGRHGGQGRMGKEMRMLRGIELTAEQRTQLRTIMEANRPAPETRTEIRTLAIAKRDGTITAEQQERLTVLKQQGKAKALAVKEQVKAILTPEQKDQIEAKKAEMKQRMVERRQRRQQQTPATDSTKMNKDN